jgi:hypothetical protein
LQKLPLLNTKEKENSLKQGVWLQEQRAQHVGRRHRKKSRKHVL